MQDEIRTETPCAAALVETEDLIDLVLESFESEKLDGLPEQVAQWSAREAAAVLEALPTNYRERFWDLVPEETRGEMLAWLGDQVRVGLLKTVEIEQAAAAASTMDTPDLAEVVDDASVELRDAILESLGEDDKVRLEDALSYPEDSAGRLMEREWVAIREDVSLETVKRYLRYRGSVPPRSTALMVVDREGVFLGKLSLETLLTQSSEATVSEVMNRDAISVNPNTPLENVAALFQNRDLVSLPVVDDSHKLIGRILLDDAIHLIRTEAEEPMMHMAGLEVDEDLLAPIVPSAARRLFWLGINLVTAFLAAWVIGLFEETLAKFVALAVLMPIVASMGGIAGSQTLTLAIRGLALGQITSANTRWLAIKEITISVINGIVWAVVVGIIVWFWFDQIGLAVVLGSAMIINLITAAVSGLAVPLILDKLGLDPALSGSVVLTTVTDVVGFLSFLGLATIFLI